MNHALILIKAEPSALGTLGPALIEVEGISEAYSVAGEWDFVAIARVRRSEELSVVVTERIATISGIAVTRTMVAFAVFSQHDLDSAFTLGS